MMRLSMQYHRLFLCILMFAQVYGSKILLVPIDHHSQVNALAMVGKALKDAGHDVWMLANKRHEKAIHRARINTILTNPSDEAQQMVQAYEVQQKLWQGNFDTSSVSIMTNANLQNCREVLGDAKLMNGMMEINFDLAVVDDFPFAECMYLVPHYLAIPHVTFSGQPKDAWSVGVTSLPSVEPNVALSFTNEMTFTQRVMNTLISVAFSYARWFQTFSMSDEEIKKYIPQRPFISNYELSRSSLLTLINFEPVCFDYPRISAPNYHYIGGASAQAVKPLSKELLAFVEGATDGIIVMTFGSIPSLASMPTHVLMTFLEGFKTLKQRVIVRQEKYEVEDIPSNVRLLKWVPQNDLLGHPNTKLFITHGGNNGQMEALYHGIPMLVMPVFADQEYAAIRAVHKGYGKTLSLQTFTAKLLHNTITELVTNNTYRQNIKKCSEITKSLPSAGNVAVFWIEHVLKFGGDHLRNPGMDMPVWKLLCIDVIVFLQGIILVLVVVGLCCCRCMLKCFCKSRAQSKTKKD